jgi:hypothetical protein
MSFVGQLVGGWFLVWLNDELGGPVGVWVVFGLIEQLVLWASWWVGGFGFGSTLCWVGQLVGLVVESSVEGWVIFTHSS